MKQFFLLIFFTCLGTNFYAQKKQLPENLNDFSEKDVMNYVWNSDDPATKTTAVPDDWKDESAVYLYFEYYYETKKISLNEAGVSFLAHYRVKLLDQHAVDDFSTAYYSASAHGNYPLDKCDRQKDFLGIKVIKPDGSEKMVNSSEFITEKNKKKVAVPNLGIGDIIDYYLYTYDYWDISNLKNFYSIIDNFVLAGQYPVKYFKYQLVTDDNWQVKFTTGEHGPKITEEEIGSKGEDYRFMAIDSNIVAANRIIWNYPYQSSGFIKLYVRNYSSYLSNYRSDSSTYRISRVDDQDIKDKYSYFFYSSSEEAATVYGEFQKYLKKAYGKADLPKEKLLEEYYYYLRHYYINRYYVYDRFHASASSTDDEDKHAIKYGENGERYVDPWLFTECIIYGLKALDIPYEIVAGLPRFHGKLADVIDAHETDYILRANLKTPVYFSKPTVFSTFNRLPASVEGTEDYVLQPTKRNFLKATKTTLPVTPAKDNTILCNYSVAFDPEDNLKLDIQASEEFNGLQMHDYQLLFVDYMKMIWNENDRYGTEKWGAGNNLRKKFQIQMDDFKKSAEEKRKSNFEKYAKGQFNSENLELINYRNETTGNEPGDSNLVIDFTCRVQDLVKKIGNDYILKAGKLFGGQITLNEKNMHRNVDVYMDYARGYEFSISIKIPEGYEVKGLDAFNTDIENSTGCLISNASVNNGILELKLKKYYYHNFEKKEDWQKMKDFLIPASLLTSKEILLKKI